MKAKIPPTSPKYKVKELEKLYSKENLKKIEKPPKRLRGELLLAIFISLIFGFLAGILGKVTLDYLGYQYPGFSLWPKQDNSEQVLKDSNNDTESKLRYNEIYQDISPSIVNIFVKKETGKTDLGGIYTDSDWLGSGLILSSDGLIVTTKRVISDLSQEYVVIFKDKKIYKAENFIADPASNLIFLSVKAENLKVTQFSNFEDLSLGQGILVMRIRNNFSQKDLFLSQIKNLDYREIKESSDIVESSEELKGAILIKASLESSYEGSPLIDLDGRVIAMMYNQEEDKDVFIPMKYIEGIISQILKENEILRPYLGIHFIDLSRLTNVPPSLSQDLKKGILILGDKSNNLPAIDKSSPADKFGLQENDIIQKVNDTALDDSVDFVEKIQNFDIGEKIKFTVLRSGVEKEIQVKLDKL